MSVLVKGMKMPDSCAACRFAGKGGYHMERVVCMFTGKNEDAVKVDRLPECPLVALPDKHGELIDRGKLLRDIEKFHLSDGKFQHWVEVQNTIVEAEDGE